MDPTLINLKAIIADMLVCEPESLNLLDSFADLGVDSLDHINLITECEDQFQISIPDEDAAGVLTIAGLYDTILRAQGIAA